ncbi:hypothetical protein YTPLAS18_32120 [Nitrospira sp.]|nr:hypothetical protein YTPLAS18_32120 [Nitrospira sp.]
MLLFTGICDEAVAEDLLGRSLMRAVERDRGVQKMKDAVTRSHSLRSSPFAVQ